MSQYVMNIFHRKPYAEMCFPLQGESEDLERCQLFIRTQYLHSNRQLKSIHKAKINVTAPVNQFMNEKVGTSTSICQCISIDRQK